MSIWHIKMHTSGCEHFCVNARSQKEASEKAKSIAEDRNIKWKNIFITKENGRWILA